MRNGLSPIKYIATVDGFQIAMRMLPAVMTQDERNTIRGEIAREHSIPRHYIHLHAKRNREKNNADSLRHGQSASPSFYGDEI